MARLTMDPFLQDLKYGARSLRKAPGVTAAVVLCLALGVGANVAVFTLFNALLLREPPVEDPDRLVSLWRTEPATVGSGLGFLSWPDFVDVRERTRTLGGLAGRVPVGTMHLTIDGVTHRPSGALVTPNYFEVLGVSMSSGRFFLSAEGIASGAEAVAVVSHSLWQELGGKPDIVGTDVLLNGHPFTVVGVGPPGFRGNSTSGIDVWAPVGTLDALYRQAAGFAGDFFQRRDLPWIRAIGRIRDGASLEAARAEMDAIAGQLAEEHPAAAEGPGLTVSSEIRMVPAIADELRRWTVSGMAVAAMVLLIACANVAGLLLARSVTRRREIAVRRALGCSGARLVRQLLVEASLAGVAAGIVAVAAITWAHGLVSRLLPYAQDFFAGVDTRPDPTVMGFALVTSLVAVPLFALGPALRAVRSDLGPALRMTSSGDIDVSRSRRLLVMAQVALTVALLTGAMLFLRSMAHSLARDSGFDPEGLLLASVELTLQGYDESGARLFYEDLERMLEERAEVATVSVATQVPAGHGPPVEVRAGADRASGDNGPAVTAMLHLTTGEYLQAAGIPLLLGRDLRSTDERAVVVNETLARRLWPTGDVLGRSVAVPPHPSSSSRLPVTGRVVGIAADTIGLSPGAETLPALWLPFASQPGSLSSLATYIHARAESGDSSGLIPLFRQAVGALDPEVPIARLIDGEEAAGWFAMEQRKAAAFLGVLGALAVLLVGLGAYGTIAHSTLQRFPEMAVRRALGASRASVIRLIVGDGLRIAVAGSMVGFAMALAAARVVESRLHGVSAYDPASVLAAVLVLLAVVTIASLVPAVRVARLEPSTVLRGS